MLHIEYNISPVKMILRTGSFLCRLRCDNVTIIKESSFLE
jgi:hypothetical protein